MALKKRDFQKIAQQVQEFLSKLACEEDTADLRDALNLALLYMQRYYKTLRRRSHSISISPGVESRTCGTLLFTSSCGAISPVSPACGVPNQFEWKWYNLESPKLSASLGTTEFSSLSPILQAVKTGDLQVLRELVSEDQEIVKSVDGLGRNGVMYAVHGNTDEHTECLKLILEESQTNLDHQANDNSTALHVAAHENNTSAMKLLLQHKVSCSINDNEGRTALHWAAANSSIDNLKLLLQHGANISVNDCEGLTPAMWACHFEQLQNLMVLKSALNHMDPREDALFEETDLKGRTVVHWAVNKTGCISCLEELLTRDSGLLCDNEKKNILHTAAEKGVLPACQLVLDVCGNDCLSMADSKARTPLHLAALCGHAEIVNFLLDKGSDLSACDSSGLTPLDIIERKQLYYCMMVLKLNPQYQNLQPGDSLNKDIFADNTSLSPMRSLRLNAFGETGNNHRTVSPSAPSESQVLDNGTKTTQQRSSKRAENNSTDGSMRRKSAPPDKQPDAPTPVPRKYRKQSAPASVTRCPTDTTNELQHKETFESASSEDKVEENQKSDSCGSEDRDKHVPVRRQSLLMRQEGIQEESSFRTTTFGMQTQDGNVLVLLGDINDLQVSDDLDMNEDTIEINCGNDHHDDEEAFEYSTGQLAEGLDSASSVHSDLDQADNCSVSVEMSVSSIESDDEGAAYYDDIPKHQQCDDYRTSPEQPENKQTPVRKNGTQQARTPLSQTSSRPPRPPQSPRQTRLFEPPDKHKENTLQSGPFPLESVENKKKKKKDKKKKVSPSYEAALLNSPLRGVAAPLDPPFIHRSFGSNLGGIEIMAPKPGPWEHGGLGILRRGSPESPRVSSNSSAYNRSSEELEVAVYGERGGGGFDRPRTPEPTRLSPRDVMNKSIYHPIPPGKGQGDLSGPSSSADNHGQSLLRNTEIMMRGQAKTDPRGGMGALPRSKSPQMTAFSLNGPLPHPPQR